MAKMLQRIQVNDLSMAYIAQGHGLPLVFLHGLGASAQLWQDLFPLYRDHYRVIAADTRGHGESAKPAGPYSIAQFAGDWAALLAALGVRQACLVGLSMGGAIAMELALAHPERVAALVLADTWSYPDPEFCGQLDRRVLRGSEGGVEAYAREASTQVFSPTYRAAHPEAVERYVESRRQLPLEPLLAATRACLAFHIRGRLGAIRVPTLVLVGSEDVLTPPRLARAIHEEIPGSKYEEIPRTGHLVNIEQPARFRELLDVFLDEFLPA
ncbi:MAG: alpha/beta fold hydrolase [Deltaproteobacteria bacterium]|nr:alpha/beta fold hydrolase [Deltaproteobacteria bacterium]MBI3079607.1 alpha/beta fold hydrolase [Deltaproteobacteria bacterium]